MKSLAVVGTGIAGMATAYLLRDKYRITVYEKNDYIGGHTNTVYVKEGAVNLPVDTGFMVYNEVTYPNLVRFFNHLGVLAKDTSMSFSVNHPAIGFEASFTDLATFFPRTRDLLSLERYRLLNGLRSLFRTAKDYISDAEACPLTLGEFAQVYGVSPLTVQRFLLPMAAAIWSTQPKRILDYPATTLFRFLANHGMLGFGDQFQWKTLVGGSQQYKDKILEKIGPMTSSGNGAHRVRRFDDHAEIIDMRGDTESYDAVVIATHADQALSLLEDPTVAERSLLGAFKYNVNPVALHSDPSVMPNSRRAWASWNYRYDRSRDAHLGSTHYWMNKLQEVSDQQDYFVSVDYKGALDGSKVHWRHVYEHPRYDRAAIEAQRRLPQLNESGPAYFCGSYFRYGFHEDAFTSALAVCTRLNDGQDPLP